MLEPAITPEDGKDRSVDRRLCIQAVPHSLPVRLNIKILPPPLSSLVLLIYRETYDVPFELRERLSNSNRKGKSVVPN